MAGSMSKKTDAVHRSMASDTEAASLAKTTQPARVRRAAP